MGHIPPAGAGCVPAGRANAGRGVCSISRAGGKLAGQGDREDADGSRVRVRQAPRDPCGSGERKSPRSGGESSAKE